MSKVLIWSCFFFLIFLISQPSYGQFLRKKKKNEEAGKHDLSTPKKRLKSRTEYKSERKTKVKRTRNYMKKKTGESEYKVKVSPKSNEFPTIIDNSKPATVKKDKPLRGIKKSKSQSEKVAESEGKKQYKKRDKQSVDKENVTQTFKTQTPDKKKKENEKQSKKLGDSDGPIKIKREPYRREPGTIYKDDPKGGAKYKSQAEDGAYTTKTKSEKRKKNDREKQENKIAGSDGPVVIEPEPYRRRPGTIYKEDPKGGSKYKSQGEKGAFTYKTSSPKKKKKETEKEEARIADSDGPIGIKPEAYRKRPGTIYREDQKGGSKYKSQGEKGAYSYNGMTPEKKEKKIAKKSMEQGNFEGDLKLAKRSKELHPSASHLDARKSKSVEEKEKTRKKELKKSRGRNSGQPKIVTEKRKKPKYDTRENKIWYE